MANSDRDADGRRRLGRGQGSGGKGSLTTRRKFLAAAVATSTSGCLATGSSGIDDPISRTVMGNETGSTPVPECTPRFSSPGEGPLTVPADSRVSMNCRGTSLDGMDDLDAWDTYEGTITSASSSFDDGQSARLEATRSENRVWAYRRFEDPLDLSDRDLSLAVHPGQGETRMQNFSVQVLAPDYDNHYLLSHPLGGLRGWFRADLGPTKVVGSPDLTDVRELRIHGWVGNEDATRFHVDSIRTTPKLDRGAVVFQFDDNLRSQYETAFPIMQEYGVEGNMSTVPRLTDRKGHVGLDGLSELADAGWDILSHPHPPRRGVPLPSLSPDEQRRLMVDSKEWLVDHGFERGARFVVWPSAQASVTSRSIGSEYHHLGFSGGLCPSGRITGPLSIGRVNGDNVEQTRRMIDMAARHRQVVVVMFHSIEDDRISVPDFRATVEHAVEADVDVITSSELWDLVRPQT